MPDTITREQMIEAVARGMAWKRAERQFGHLIDMGEVKTVSVNAIDREDAQVTLTALEALGVALVPGWQPIETAKKDGTPLLLRARCKTATSTAPVIGWYIEGMGWIELAFAPNAPIGIVPEMWMPLPASPLHGEG